MIKYILIISLVLLSNISIYAQEYWQQEVDYRINIELNDSSHILIGDIEIAYKNNSPTELNYIYFHLWANAYSSETSALCEQMLLHGDDALYNATEEEKGFISEINFTVNDAPLKWEYDSEHIDIAKVLLNKPLKSGETVIIKTPFKVKIPSSDFSRLGHSDQSYQITQWYPKPAVYDNDGWHQMPYLNQGEFYSEYGTYDVSITVPKNYIIGATGDMVNGTKEEQWLDSISDQTKLIENFDEDSLGFPPSSKETKTLIFHQEKVHDFAWFADKRYHVLRKEIVLENGHKILMQAMFTNEEADLWMQSITYLEQSTKFYSDFVGDYPYNHVTAVQGALSAGAGMEYPNITIIGISRDKYTLEETIMHEVGHNWFYGMLGFNERDNPWMDEGINTFVQNEYMHKYQPDLSVAEHYLSGLKLFKLDQVGLPYFSYLMNKFTASYNLDQACGLHSSQYTSGNYGISVYMKTAMIIDYLQQYLGKEEFSIIFKSFFDKWKYKHPKPSDFKEHFEKQSGKDLSWVFDDLINTKKRIDYKISSIKKNGDSLQIKITNKGKINGPVHIKAIDDGGITLEDKWVDGFEGKQTIGLINKNPHRITINSDYSLLDYTPRNNTYNSDKALHKSRKLKLKFITTAPKNNEQYLYFTPVLGWNNYNKLMAGVLIFNHSLMEKKWEYELMPLYSFNQKTLNGSFGLHRNFYTRGFIRRMSIGIVGKKYEYTNSRIENYKFAYLKLSPEVKFYFKNPDGNSKISNTARIRIVHIDKEVQSYDYCMSSMSTPVPSYYNYSILDIDYHYKNNRILNPYGFDFNLQAGASVTKASLSINYAFSYNDRKKNALEMRLFVGNIFSSNNSSTDFTYKMSSFDGGDDYLYDYTYMDRSGYSGFYSHQITPADGSFYLQSPIGRSWGFISALNIRAGLPFTKFIKVYGNLGYSSSAKSLSVPYDKSVLGEAGVLLTFFNRNFEVYFPLLWTSQFQGVMDLRPDYKYSDNIRFTIRFDLMNPFKLKKEFNL